MNVFIHVQRWYTDRDLRFAGIFSMLGFRDYLTKASTPLNIELKFVRLDDSFEPSSNIPYEIQKYSLVGGSSFYAHDDKVFNNVDLLLIDITSNLNMWLFKYTEAPSQPLMGQPLDTTYFEDMYPDEEEERPGCGNTGCYCSFK